MGRLAFVVDRRAELVGAEGEQILAFLDSGAWRSASHEMILTDRRLIRVRDEVISEIPLAEVSAVETGSFGSVVTATTFTVYRDRMPVMELTFTPTQNPELWKRVMDAAIATAHAVP